MDLIFLRCDGAPSKECLENLENVLALLNKDIRPAVERVLYEARTEEILGEAPGHGIDIMRQYENRRKMALSNLEHFRRYLASISFPNNAPPIRWLDDAIRNLKALEQPGPYRRVKEGRQRQPWINKARRKLKLLGVPRELSEEILVASGLRRTRDNKSAVHGSAGPFISIWPWAGGSK